jgi:hypothetical protein
MHSALTQWHWRGARAPGVIGSIDVSGQFDSSYLTELQGYADRGSSLPADILAKAEEVYKAAVDYASKAEAVAEDTSTGAAIGALIPVLGEIGVGEAAGAIVGAIYGVIDNFGGDIHDLFNPPDFKEDDYKRQQRAQVASGAIPVYGVPPDQYGACIYPDGAKSGGDWPYPGTWNGEIRDQAAYDRAKARDAAAQYGVTLGANGMPMKPMIPLATRLRAPVRAVLEQRAKLSKNLSATATNAHIRNLLQAELARRQAISKSFTASLDAARRNPNALRFLRASLAQPAAPAIKPMAVERASAPPAPATSTGTTLAIVGGGVAVSAAAIAAAWSWFRGARR